MTGLRGYVQFNNYSHTYTLVKGVCKKGIPWLISVTENFPTEMPLISVDFFTENSFSTELGIPWGSRNLGVTCS